MACCKVSHLPHQRHGYDQATPPSDMQRARSVLARRRCVACCGGWMPASPGQAVWGPIGRIRAAWNANAVGKVGCMGLSKNMGIWCGGRMDVPLCINVRQLETVFRGETGSTCLCGAKTIFAFFFGAILVPSGWYPPLVHPKVLATKSLRHSEIISRSFSSHRFLVWWLLVWVAGGYPVGLQSCYKRFLGFQTEP